MSRVGGIYGMIGHFLGYILVFSPSSMALI